MEEQEAIKILKSCWVMNTNHVLDEQNVKLKQAIEILLKINSDLHKSVDQIYNDYQDVGLKMFQNTETLDKVKEFLNEKIHYKVSHKQGDELKNILMKEIVRQLNLYRKEILKIIKEGKKHG